MLSLAIALTFADPTAAIAIDAQSLLAMRAGSPVYVASLDRNFEWLPASTAVADGSTVLQPTAVGVGPGRLVVPTFVPGSIGGGGTNQLLWSASSAVPAAWSGSPILATSLRVGVAAGAGSIGVGQAPPTGAFGLSTTVDGTIGLFTSNSAGPTHTQVRVENLGGQNCGFNLRTNNNNIGMRALVGVNQDLDFSNFDGSGAFLAQMLQINTANARINAFGNFFWEKTVVSPQITHTQRAIDAACTNLTITSQAPFAGATGTNRNPGNLNYVVPTPAAGGTAGKHSMQVSGAEIWGVESTGVRVTTGAVSNTMSAAAGPSGTTTLVVGGGGGGSLQVGSGRFAPPASASSVVMQFVSANETDFNGLVKITNNAATFFKILLDAQNSAIQFDKTAASPALTHNAQTTDVACTNWTLTSQAPAAGATGTNRNPGSFVYSVPAPTAGGTAGSHTFNVSAAQVLKLGAGLVGLYTATPVAQPAAVGALTDSTTGTPATTLVDVGAVPTQANINNNFASVLTKLNAINTRLSAALGGIGVTA